MLFSKIGLLYLGITYDGKHLYYAWLLSSCFKSHAGCAWQEICNLHIFYLYRGTFTQIQSRQIHGKIHGASCSPTDKTILRCSCQRELLGYGARWWMYRFLNGCKFWRACLTFGRPVRLLICVHGRRTKIHLKFNLKMTMISI